MKKVSFFCSLITLLFVYSSLFAKEVSIEKDGFVYLAEHTLASGKTDKDDTFLILHGTLAHNKMEIVQQLSELLHERGFNTLAINLSLGISKRDSEFYDCSQPHKHSLYDAISELEMWTDWLVKKGVKRIVAAGHSRGGNQVALFSKDAPEIISHFVLIAPATWSKKEGEGKPKDVLVQAEKLVKNNKPKEMLKADEFLYCREDADFSAESYVSYYADDERKNTPQVIAASDKNFLVFAGGEDEIVADLPDMMAKHTSDNSNILFVTIKGADHFFRDLYLDDIVDQTLDFIDE